MHHAEILIGHFREMVRNWPVANCYFALCLWVPNQGYRGPSEVMQHPLSPLP